MFGYYKGIEVAVWYDGPPEARDQFVLSMHKFPIWSDSFLYPKDSIWPIWLGTRHPRGDPRHSLLKPLFKAITLFQKEWRYNRPIKRIPRRTAIYKEELMAAAWHPRRVGRWLDAGIAPEDM